MSTLRFHPSFFSHFFFFFPGSVTMQALLCQKKTYIWCRISPLHHTSEAKLRREKKKTAAAGMHISLSQVAKLFFFENPPRYPIIHPNLRLKHRRAVEEKKKVRRLTDFIIGRVYDHHSIITPEGSRECNLGLECYRNSYWITLGAVLLSLAATLGAIKRHRGRSGYASISTHSA